MQTTQLSPKEQQFYNAKLVVHELEMQLIGPSMNEHRLRLEMTTEEIKRVNDAFMKKVYEKKE